MHERRILLLLTKFIALANLILDLYHMKLLLKKQHSTNENPGTGWCFFPL